MNGNRRQSRVQSFRAMVRMKPYSQFTYQYRYNSPHKSNFQAEQHGNIETFFRNCTQTTPPRTNVWVAICFVFTAG